MLWWCVYEVLVWFSRVCSPARITMPKGWMKAPVLDGWVQIVRGPRPKSEQWPSAKSGKKSPQLRYTKVVHPYFPPHQPSRPPEQVVAEANEEVLKLEAAVRARGGERSVHAKPFVEALKAARAKSRVLPVSERLVACRNFLERARLRVARAEDLIAEATEQKSAFVLEVQEAEERGRCIAGQHSDAGSVVRRWPPINRCHPADAKLQSSRVARMAQRQELRLRNALEFGGNTTPR